MRLFGQFKDRGPRVALIGMAAGVALYAAFQLFGAFGGRTALIQRRQDLEDARLVATMAPVIEDAHVSFQDDAGMAGSTLPEALVERLKAAYALHGEDGKTRLPSSSTALAGALSIDLASAEFITEARGLPDWDAVAARKRGLFDENRATLQALVYSEISKIAAESGIGKLDNVKVEAPRTVRGRRSAARKNGPTAKADPNSSRELREHVDAAGAALAAADDGALRDALSGAVSLAQADPSIRRSARASIVGLLEGEELSDTQSACIRLAALASQPDATRALGHILNAHLDDALAVLPAPPSDAPEDDADADEADDDGDGEGDQDTASEEDGDGHGDEDTPSEAGERSEAPADTTAPEPELAASEDANAEPEAAPDAESATDAPEGDDGAKVDGDGDERTDSEDASETAEATPPSDDPVAFHAQPFPPLPALAASVQRRLLTALKEAGPTWLTDEQVAAILDPPEPAEPDAEPSEEAGENSEDAESLDSEAAITEGDENADDDRDASPAESEVDAADHADETERADGESLADDADGQTAADDGDADKADGATEADDVDDPADAGEPLVLHPDAALVRAYQVDLVDALWQVTDLLNRTGIAKGGKYTATLQFKGPLDQVVNFVHKLETQKPWMRVTAMRIAIDNADQPMLALTLSLEATIL
ncbi:hypothetical protein CMK11_11040 [Candidatus Poribacteria bacterium]|nr:hypothetical protein [Candidatus Poribacteria bacterium]